MSAPKRLIATPIAAGEYHTCMRDSGSLVTCWGSFLANGDSTGTVPLWMPHLVGAPPIHSMRLVAGQGHNCSLGTSGTVACWGGAAAGLPYRDEVGSASPTATPFTVINTAPQLRTGTDNAVIGAPVAAPVAGAAPTAGAGGDYGAFDTPAVWRSRNDAQQKVAAMEENGTDRYDIPAFLRKQAD